MRILFLLATGPSQCRTNRGGGRCHPFRRSRSHLEEADHYGTPPTVTEVGFEPMTLVFERRVPNPLGCSMHIIKHIQILMFKN